MNQLWLLPYRVVSGSNLHMKNRTKSAVHCIRRFYRAAVLTEQFLWIHARKFFRGPAGAPCSPCDLCNSEVLSDLGATAQIQHLGPGRRDEAIPRGSHGWRKPPFFSAACPTATSPTCLSFHSLSSEAPKGQPHPSLKLSSCSSQNKGEASTSLIQNSTFFKMLKF